jgi:hypothetical protein
MSKCERGSSGHLVFTVIAFSGHDLSVTGRGEKSPSQASLLFTRSSGRAPRA